ncbi:MAG: hypothetical protein M1334_02580 [Patescibacteria group bacterium]|nr:hypothetical protein [Patescibacteria group bacterium]
MSKRENIDINYLNKFDKANPDSDTEARFDNEIEAIAQEDLDKLIEKGELTEEVKCYPDGKNKEIFIRNKNGDLVYYENEKAYSGRLNKNTKDKPIVTKDQKAGLSDSDDQNVIRAESIFRAAELNGDLIVENKLSKDNKYIEESTVKTKTGEVASYINIKAMSKIRSDKDEARSILNQINSEKKSGKKSPWANN